MRELGERAIDSNRIAQVAIQALVNEDVYEVREELFPDLYPSGKYPPNTLLVIDRLVKPEFLLEIEAIAYVPTSGPSDSH